MPSPDAYDRPITRAEVRSRREIAREALACYDLEPARLTFVTAKWNTLFRVETRDGCRFALRISKPDVRDETAIHSELAWLTALHRETDLIVPEPRPARGGSLLVTVGGEEPRHCVLFGWIEGRRAPERPSTRTIALLGETAALLESHADRFKPPAEFMRERLDRASTWHAEGVIFSDAPHPLLDARRRAYLRRAYARIQAALDDLYADPSGLRFLHIDLHLANVLLQRGRLAVLDFDDSLWAFPIQDVAISLYCVRTWFPDRPELYDVFKGGYRRHRAWTEGWDEQLPTFIQHRLVDDLTAYLSDPGERAQQIATRLLELAEEMLPEARVTPDAGPSLDRSAAATSVDPSS